jgi:hypothetical protein
VADLHLALVVVEEHLEADQVALKVEEVALEADLVALKVEEVALEASQLKLGELVVVAWERLLAEEVVVSPKLAVLELRGKR